MPSPVEVSKKGVQIKGKPMAPLENIAKLYEMACEILTPKSYQWKVVAQKMYELAKEQKENQ